MRIYLPMTADIITPGHIKAILKAREYGPVVIGLLTDRAIKGYKRVAMAYPDRKYVMQSIASGISGVIVVPQDDLNPYKNMNLFGCKAIASGDGFEDIEERAAKALDATLLTITLDDEQDSKKWSSTRIKNKVITIHNERK